MIVLFPCDVAYAYDALSILYVKQRHSARQEVAEAMRRGDDILRGQVGARKHHAVLESPEYARLIEVNQRLFDAFDWLHTIGLTADPAIVKVQAIETDRINGVDRPAAKRALQERWFGTALTEVKLGYGGGS